MTDTLRETKAGLENKSLQTGTFYRPATDLLPEIG